MKKFAFLFVAVAAISLASCGDSTKTATEAQDSTCCADSTDSVAADTVVADSVVADSAAAVK